MNADGTDVRRLTDSPGLDEGPVWSPDGTKISFSSDRDGQQEIYVMNADGSDQRRLTDNPARDESPDWQPLPFDATDHTACGDDDLASGGASSVVALQIPCRPGAAHRSPMGAGSRRRDARRHDQRLGLHDVRAVVRSHRRALRRSRRLAARPRVRLARPLARARSGCRAASGTRDRRPG
jgi:WD40 repeat protein